MSEARRPVLCPARQTKRVRQVVDVDGALDATPGLCRIIPGHGDPVVDRPAEVLAAVASRL